MKKKVEFYYDFASPYSYLASTQIEKLCEGCNAGLEWRPFLLGGVYKETGNRAPLEVPSKFDYLKKDLKDWAKYYRIELNFPSLFPLNSVKAMRGALVLRGLDKFNKYNHSLFRLYWVNGKDLSNDEVLKEAVAELGIDPERFIEKISRQEIKDRLREETAEAARRGAFGAPTFFVGEEMFWGNDRLKFLEEYLKGNL